MNIDKDYLIYGLSLVVSVLIGYIIMQEPHVEIVTKTKIKTIVKQKIVYQDNKECNEKRPTEKTVISQNDIKVVKKKEHIISISTDNRHRFAISLVSNEKFDTKDNLKNIILNGTIKSEDYQSIFIIDVNQAILKQNDIFFKIEDKHLKTISFGDATCLQDVIEDFIYKVELEIIDNDITCMVFQDREIQENNKPTIKQKENILPKLQLPKEFERDLQENNLEKKLEFQKNIEEK